MGGREGRGEGDDGAREGGMAQSVDGEQRRDFEGVGPVRLLRN